MAHSLKEALAGLMNKLEDRKQGALRGAPEDILKKVFTKKELEHIKSSSFKNEILTVRVDSSGWLYALSLKKDDKLNKMRDKLKIVTRDIRFYLGE